MDNRRHPSQKPSGSSLKRKASTSRDDPPRSQKGEESRRKAHVSKRRAGTSKRGRDDNVEAQQIEEEMLDDEGDEEMKYLCTVCEKFDSPDGFWIQCDNCDTWYHGACVEVSKETSDRIDSFECAICQNKLA